VPTEDSGTGNVVQRMFGAGPRRFGAVLSAVLAIELAIAFARVSSTPMPEADRGAAAATVYDIGVRLFRDYAFAFEATSVLILVSMVGAIVLAGRKEAR